VHAATLPDRLEHPGDGHLPDLPAERLLKLARLLAQSKVTVIDLSAMLGQVGQPVGFDGARRHARPAAAISESLTKP
jgi:hypothetical protein